MQTESEITIDLHVKIKMDEVSLAAVALGASYRMPEAWDRVPVGPVTSNIEQHTALRASGDSLRL